MWRAQLVVTAAEELQQVLEKLSRRGGLDVVLQLASRRCGGEAERTGLCRRGAETWCPPPAAGDSNRNGTCAPASRCAQLAGRLRAIDLRIQRLLLAGRGMQDGGNARDQFRGGVSRVGDGENFVGAGSAGLDQVRDTTSEDRGLAGAGAGDHQHGAMNVLDSLLLLAGRDEFIGGCGHCNSGRARRKSEYSIMRQEGGHDKGKGPEVANSAYGIVILRRVSARRRICGSSRGQDSSLPADSRSFDSGARRRRAYAQDDNSMRDGRPLCGQAVWDQLI